MIQPDIRRGCQPKSPHQSCAKIRKDVTEHVLGHQHVKIPRLLHHPQRGRVNIGVIRCQVGTPRRFFIENSAEKGKGAKHVGLVDAGDVAPAAPACLARRSKVKGKAEQLFRNIACDQQRFAGLVFGHFAAPLGVKQPFGAFTDQHEINLAPVRYLERAVLACAHRDGADACEQCQRLAQVDLWRDFRAIRVTHIRQAHRRQQDCIGVPGNLHRRIWQRLACLGVMRCTRWGVFERQIITGCALGQAREDIDRRRDDFRANAIPFKNSDVKGLCHGCDFLLGA